MARLCPSTSITPLPAGQDANATIKRQLQRLLNGVSIFLDVDDLKEIGDLELYIDQSLVINIFLSHWYFKSKNCLREVESTVDKAKPLMLTHEVEVPKGGGPLEAIMMELDDQRLKDVVFAEGRLMTIWYRIAAFQLISLKQLAKFTLLQTPAYRDRETLDIFVPGELLLEELVFEKPVMLYASPHNPGAQELAIELTEAYENLMVTSERPAVLAVDSDTEAGSTSGQGSSTATHFLLYLNFNTYLNDAGVSLAEELRRARATQLPIVMAHENDPELDGCDFFDFSRQLLRT